MSLDKYFERGKELIQNKQFHDALSVYGAAMAKGTGSLTCEEKAELHFLKGCMHVFTESRGAPLAKQEFEETLRIYPWHAGAGRELVNCERERVGRFYSEEYLNSCLWPRLFLRTQLPQIPPGGIDFAVNRHYQRDWGHHKLNLDLFDIVVERICSLEDMTHRELKYLEHGGEKNYLWRGMSREEMSEERTGTNKLIAGLYLLVPHPTFSRAVLESDVLEIGLSSQIPNEIILSPHIYEQLDGIDMVRTPKDLRTYTLSFSLPELKLICDSWSKIFLKLGYIAETNCFAGSWKDYYFPDGSLARTTWDQKQRGFRIMPPYNKAPYSSTLSPSEPGPSLLPRSLPLRGETECINGMPFYQHCRLDEIKICYSGKQIFLSKSRDKFPIELKELTVRIPSIITLYAPPIESLVTLSEYILSNCGSEEFRRKIWEAPKLVQSIVEESYSTIDVWSKNYPSPEERKLQIALLENEKITLI